MSITNGLENQMANLKVSNVQFQVFKEACEEYLKSWGLQAWNVKYVQEEMKDAYARVWKDLESMLATIALSKTWNNSVRPLNDVEIKEVAKHEVLHLLLGKLFELAQYRYLSRRELEAAEHEAIQLLMKIVPSNHGKV